MSNKHHLFPTPFISRSNAHMKKSLTRISMYSTIISIAAMAPFALQGLPFVAQTACAQVVFDEAKEKPDLSDPTRIALPPMDPYVLYYVPEKPQNAPNIQSPKDCTAASGTWKTDSCDGAKCVGCIVNHAKTGLFYETDASRGFSNLIRPQDVKPENASGFIWYIDGKREGYRVRLWKPSESVESMTFYENDVANGPSFTWNESGVMTFAGYFKNGRPDGTLERYQECLPLLLGQYKDGKPIGLWQRYIEPGIIATQANYDRPAPKDSGLPENAYWTEWYNAQGVRILEGYTAMNSPDDENMFYVGEVQLYSTNGIAWRKVKYDRTGNIDDKELFDLCNYNDSNEIPKFINFAHDEMTIYCKRDSEYVYKRISYYPTGNLWRIETINRNGYISAIDEFHPTGEKLASYKLDDGMPLGKIEFLNTDGSVMHTSNIDNGTGEFTAYWYNGKPRTYSKYRDGLKTGLWKTWFESGNPESESEFLNGVPMGVERAWFSNGVMASELHYRNGQLDGDVLYYYTDGRIASKGKFKRDNPIGKQYAYLHSGGIDYENDFSKATTHQTRYFSNGDKRAEGDVIVTFGEGFKVGVWQYYLKQGKSWVKIEYDYGEIESAEGAVCTEMGGSYKLDDENREMGCTVCAVNRQSPLRPKSYREGTWLWWNENGEIETIGGFRLGKLDGTWTYFYPNGSLMLKGKYAIDKRNGNWTGYYEDGSKKFSGEYVDGVEAGLWQTYYKGSGSVSSSGSFVKGKRTGKWVYPYESGKTRETGEMLDGKETGNWVQYYENGEKLGEGKFENGKRQGKWTWWRQDGAIWKSVNYKDGKEIKGSQQ